MTDSIREAELKKTETGVIPQGDGWFGEERRLKTWDFVHCPPWTRHVFVGTGQGPCVIVMAGSRAEGFEVVYPVNDVAAKHGASVLEETSKPADAHADFGPEERSAYRDGWLP